MKKFTFFTFVLLFSCIISTAQQKFVKYSQTEEGIHQLTFFVNNWNLNNIKIGDKQFKKISFPSNVFLNKKGWAELPYLSASLQLSNNKDFTFKIISSEYEDINIDLPMLPSQGIIKRNQNPLQIPFTIDPKSIKDEFYPSQLVKSETPFIIRNVRGTTIKVNPFQYNSAKNILRIYSKIEVQIVEHSNSSTNPLKNTTQTPINEEIGLYKSIFINYDSPKSNTTLNIGEYGDILVIATPTYAEAIEPYIKWKREKGYHVDLKIVDIGTNVKTIIKEEYDNNNRLMFVQLVGDWDQLKSDIMLQSITPEYEITPSNSPMDPKMGCVSGSDNYPDISVGRFSCSSATDLSIQIEKAINYEKKPNIDENWRETFIGIASNDNYENPYGDDYESDYDHIGRIFANKLQSPIFTYQTIKENYEPNESLNELINNINAGASTIAYCGHGASDSWITTNYSSYNINQATNGDKLPFIVSVACVNGQFNNGNCFAENWLRKADGGAVVTLMSSIDQPWQPPQRGQDYFYDILSGGYNYDNDNISTTFGFNTYEQRTHWGSIVVNATNLMLSEASEDEDIATVFTWTTFGDASLQLRTQKPKHLTLSDTTISFNNSFTGIAKIDGENAANVLICISQGNNYFSYLTDSDGTFSIPHNFTNGEILLVATAFNTTTIYDTILIANNRPFIQISNYAPQIVKFNENNKLSISLKNTGTQPTSGKSKITLSTSDPYITLYTFEKEFEELETNSSILFDSTFIFSIKNDVKNEHQIHIAAFIENGMYKWTDSIILTVQGPDCETINNFHAKSNQNNVSLLWDNPTIINDSIFDNFETHPPFTINSAGNIGWNYIDKDDKASCNFNTIDFEYEGYKMAYIVMNTNLISGSYASNMTAYSGTQFIGFPALQDASSNKDLIISPELNFSGEINFSFYARSANSNFPYEKFEIVYSTSGKEYSDFLYLTDTPDTTTNTWTKYSYTVPAGSKYIGIKCVSAYQYILCIDDISISGLRSVDQKLVNIYVNDSLIADSLQTDNFSINDLANGYHCFHISALCENGNESAFSIDTCLAIGNVETFSATATAHNGGSITPNGETIAYKNQDLTFFITPDYCYKIDSVVVNGELKNLTANNELIIKKISTNINIDAYFSIKKLNIYALAENNGSISPSGIVETICGNNNTFEITANEGYSIDKVFVNDSNAGYITSYTFENIHSSASIVAKFKEIVFTCDTPTNITVSNTNEHINISWTNSENAIGYNIYRNDVFIDSTNNTFYIDTTAEIGNTYTFQIKTICQNGESQLSQPLTITLLNISAFNNDILIYPNPANNSILISAKDFREVEIHDMLGQTVYSSKIESPTHKIDIQKFNKGLYIIRLVGEKKYSTNILEKM